MSDSGNPSSTPVPKVGKSPPNRARNPIERVIVWGGIAALVGVTLFEAHARLGYSSTIAGLTRQFRDDYDRVSSLSEVRKSVWGFPREDSVASPSKSRRNIELKWPSLLNDYRVEFAMEREGDDPIVLGFSTPGGVDPDEVGTRQASNQDSKPPVSRILPVSGPMQQGASVAGRPARGGPGAGGQRRLSLLSIALRPEVAGELKLTEDQSNTLGRLQDLGRLEFMKLQALPEGQRSAAMVERRETQEQQVKSSIDESQFTRLRQLFWRESGLAILERDDAALAAGLSAEQREQLKSLLQERQTELRALRDGDEKNAKRLEWEERLRAVLSPEQLAQWEQVLGGESSNREV